MNRVSFFLALMALSGVFGCQSRFAQELARLQEAKLQWSRSAIADYSITLLRTCECTDEMRGPVTITVRQGVIERRYADGRVVSEGLAPLFPTIEGLFEHIKNAYSIGAPSVEVQYEKTTGYPQLVSVDYDLQLADEESNYLVNEFHVLPLE